MLSLTYSHTEIQKIIAFENSFERLLGIIHDEGGVMGSIVVQDCVGVLINLLDENASNQVSSFKSIHYISNRNRISSVKPAVFPS